jgi:hypothetical protein
MAINEVAGLSIVLQQGFKHYLTCKLMTQTTNSFEMEPLKIINCLKRTEIISCDHPGYSSRPPTSSHHHLHFQQSFLILCIYWSSLALPGFFYLGLPPTTIWWQLCDLFPLHKHVLVTICVVYTSWYVTANISSVTISSDLKLRFSLH